MADKPDWAIAGTWPDDDHGMDRKRKEIRKNGRPRRLAIIEYTASDGKVHRPEDGPDQWTEILTIRAIHPAATDADEEQLGAMLAAARNAQPGQQVMAAPGETAPGETAAG